MAAPGTSSCMRLSSRKNVDLPQPEGPIKAVTSPAGMTSVTPSKTRWSPNQAQASLASSVAAPVGGPPTRRGGSLFGRSGSATTGTWAVTGSWPSSGSPPAGAM